MAMGAEFTQNMSGSNMVVIAAYVSGLKHKKPSTCSLLLSTTSGSKIFHPMEEPDHR
ncbi:hypothetical protein PILCRDRAFT_741312 [Piloderma croceum F 1598]|uniref:Uncharacterized protein n=1 Tax=Piloderma croceum (strain F 1598) TaxID=765440 RepID=A0A0C3EIE5_PILCF|nr:hypothetical protein PILCRDRAFT_741312 [Piloderma croceum F 1598]